MSGLSSGEPPDAEAGWSEWLRRVRWPEQTLLGRLPQRSQTGLLALGGFRQFPSGAHLMHEGDATTFVAVLLRGWTKVTALTDTGGLALLAVRHGGDLIGEFAGLDAQPRSATVTAVGGVLAKVIRSEEFAGYLARDPAASAEISRSIVAKTRFSIRRRVEFAGSPVAVRVARVLVELDRAYGIDRTEGGRALGVPLTQQELAALVGAHDPTVHKALRALRRDKIIETGYRSVVILDLPALRIAAGLPSS